MHRPYRAWLLRGGVECARGEGVVRGCTTYNGCDNGGFWGGFEIFLGWAGFCLGYGGRGLRGKE